MKFSLILLATIALFSCQQKSIDVKADLWHTVAVKAQHDSTKTIGCKITSYDGKHFDGIIPTHIGGERVLEIESLVNAKSILSFPNDTSLTTLDFSKAHYLRSIGSNAFYGQKYITTIILNKRIERIEEGAFADCRRLENIAWGKNINFIGEASFYNCDGLKSVTIPEKVDSLHPFAFYACGGLEEVIFSPKVTYIGERAFANCSRVKEINLPKSLTFIGTKAFLNHRQVKTITIPAKVVEIGDKAFLNCTQLASLTIKNKSGIKINDNTFLSCPIMTSENAVIYYPKEANYPEMEHWQELKGRWLAE